MSFNNLIFYYCYWILIAIFSLGECKLDKIKTPPMGFMAWEVFRCQTDCDRFPDNCVNEKLFMEMGQKMLDHGYVNAGYKVVSIDDCWMEKERDIKTNKLIADTSRFPKGLMWLSNYLKKLGNISLGLYYDIGNQTCAKFPGSQYFIEKDAMCLDEWEIDYIKVDGCNVAKMEDYEKLYPKLGYAIDNNVTRKITYSCSWPAYFQPSESSEDKKPFDKYIKAGCNIWRNYVDIQCSWKSMKQVIDHFGNNSKILAKIADGSGHYHDMDMLLVGNTCITLSEAQVQMGIWSIMASPLIMGNDLRKVPKDHHDLLINPEVISINQDPLSLKGYRFSPFNISGEIWIRFLVNNNIAIGLLNKSEKPTEITFSLQDIFLSETRFSTSSSKFFKVRDVFLHKTLKNLLFVNDTFSIKIDPHSLKLFRLYPINDTSYFNTFIEAQ